MKVMIFSMLLGALIAVSISLFAGAYDPYLSDAGKKSFCEGVPD